MTVAREQVDTLYDRDDERAAIADALATARAGDGRIVLVTAPAGLGKTSLLRAALHDAAADGFTTLRARASELERDFAYGCVRQLLEASVVAGGGDVFAGAAALAEPLFAPTGAAPQPNNSFSMLHGLYWLLNNLTVDSPVALAVDDLHWADAESLWFLNYLAPRLDGLPLIVFATTRPSEGDVDAVARLAASPETTHLRLRPLSTDAVAALSERRLGAAVAPEFAAACREATGGNPLFLRALLREVIDRALPTDAPAAAQVRAIGPTEVAEAIRLRLADKPPAATTLVRALAVIGDGASVAETHQLTGLDEHEAGRAADLLVTLGILNSSEQLEFAHPIVREAIYSGIGVRQRAESHARAAEVLTAAGAAPERIAAQIVETEPTGDPARIALLLAVAADATARGAPAAAVAWLRRALAEDPPPAVRVDVLHELGSAELRIGSPDAVKHLSEAVDKLTEPSSLATSARQLANALTISDDADRAVDTLERIIAIVEPQDHELALLMEADLASHALQANVDRRGPSEQRLERFKDLEGRTPGERLVLASVAFMRARASESAEEAADYLEATLTSQRFVGEQDLDIVGPLYDVAIALLSTDRVGVLAGALEQALADARSSASVPALAFLTSRRGWVALCMGSVTQAENDARAAIEFLRAHRIPLGIPLATALLVEALSENGELDAAEHALAEAGMGEEIGLGPTKNFLLQARGKLRLAQGRTRAGIDDLIEFGRRDERFGAANPIRSRWRSHVAVGMLAIGEHEGARRFAADDLEKARRWGANSGIGIALRARGLAEGGDAGLELLCEAAVVLEDSPMRHEQARALTDRGAALRRAGHRSDARSALYRALELADRCGAGAISARAKEELRAAGGRWSAPTASGAELLTASERRVAELAAEGQSNPEIAQTLFVTRKTVETHLGRAYRKLDISGRADLPQALASSSPT